MTDFPTGFILSTILKASNLDLCGNLEPTPGNFLLLGPGRPSRGRRGIKKLPNERFHEFFARTYRVVFLTGPLDFQYQNEKRVAANQDYFVEKFSM